MQSTTEIPKDERRTRRLLKALTIAALLLIVTTALILAFLGPAIASVLARGAIEDAINPTIEGSVRVDSVSLSWNGPQSIAGVEILDDAGTALASFDADAGAGLLALITGDRDLGAITVTRTNTQTLDRDTLDRIVRASASTAPPTGEPLRLPTEIAARATIDLGSVELEGARFDDARAVATIEAGGAVSAILTARAQDAADDVRLELDAPTLVQPDGLVDLSASGLTIKATGEAPAQLLASLLGVDPAGAGALSIDASLVTRDGSLVPAGDDAVRVTGVIPSALLRTDAGARFDSPPAFTIEATDLDVPLPSTGFAPDPARIRAAFTLDADPVTGSIDDGSGGRLGFATERITAGVAYDPERGRATIEGGAQLFIDGRPGGRLEIDALADGLVDDVGAIRPGGPERLTAEASILSVPGALIASLHPALADARAIVGDAIDASAEIGITADARTLNNAGVSAGQPTVRVLVEGERGGFDAHTFYDGARALRTVGDPGIVATTRAAGLLAQRLLGENMPVTLADDADATLRISEATIALSPDGGVDTTSLAGRASVDIEGLRESGDDDRAGSRVLANATLTSGDLAWDLDARLDGSSATGQGTVAGALTGAPAPAGRLTLDNVPTALAEFVSPGVHDALLSAFGDRLAGSVRTDDATSGDLSLTLSGDLGALVGSLRVAEGFARVPAGRPLVYTSQRPSALVRTLIAEAAGLPIELTSGALSVRVDEAAIDLSADAPLAGIDAAGSVTIADARGRVDGRPLRVDTLALTASLDTSGTLAARVDLEGSIDGNPMTASGPIRIDRLHAGDGAIDPAGVSLSADLSASIPAPLVLAAIRDDAQRSIASRLLGDDTLTLALQDTGTEGSVALSIASTTTGFDARAPFAPTPAGLATGGARVRAELTDALLADLLAGTPYAGVRTARDTAVVLTAEPLTVPWGEGPVPDFGGIGAVTARAVLDDELTLQRVPSPMNDTTNDVTLAGVMLAFEGTPARGRLLAGGQAFPPSDRSRSLAFDAESAFPFAGADTAITLRGDSDALDDVLGSGGTLRDTLGERFTLDAGRDADDPDAIRVALDSGNLVVESLVARTPAGGFETRGRSRLEWTLPAPSATALLLGEREARAGLRVDRPLRIVATINELALGDPASLLAPDVFRLNGTIASSPLVFADRTGAQEDLGAYTGSVARLDDGAIELRLVGDRDQGGRTLEVYALADGYADSTGAPTPGAIAARELDIEGELPTRLVDILGGTDGLATALIGPTTTVRASVVDPASQSIEAGFAGANATGAIRGVRAEGLFTIEPDGGIAVTRISDEASRRLLGVALPMFTAFEKTADDEPASVVTSELRIPLDGDISRLDGALRIDPGSMRFATRSFFGRVLELAGGNAEGQIGKRLEPFNVRLDKGVIRYEDIMLPIGEVTLVVGGRVNLKSRRVNTVVWVPFSALED
ncbi:MAG: hypothetical protein AAGH64_04300, partial [Planctomycetota bacterium]